MSQSVTGGDAGGSRAGAVNWKREAVMAAKVRIQKAATRWWVLAVASVAQLMVVLDVTVVNIALPSAQRSLAFSDADRQWVVTAYSLAFGSLLLIGGKLSDLLRRNPTFVARPARFAG